MRRLRGLVRREDRPPQLRPSTVRAEYESAGRCGATPTGEDAPDDPVLPCTLPRGHASGHRSPSGWAWPNRSGS
jgi:hypothetical protein